MIVFLIGFMGSGKTSYGKKLATLLSYEFIDLDNVVEENEKSKIPVIFMEKGELYFRKAEQKALHRLFYKRNCVIACGGGTPCFENNISEMNKNGCTVLLRLDRAELLMRLTESKRSRPLLDGKQGSELEVLVNSMLKQRNRYYRQASLVINPSFIGPLELVNYIDLGTSR